MIYENFNIKSFMENHITQNSNMILFSSRVGIGKTTFAIYFIQELFKQNKKVLFFSLENSVDELTHKIKDITKNYSFFNNLYLSNEINQEKILREIKKNSNISLIIFDYLQLYKFDEKFLEKLKSMKIPILILSQLNRQNLKNKIPNKKDIREIELLDKYIDIFLFLYKNSDENVEIFTKK